MIPPFLYQEATRLVPKSVSVFYRNNRKDIPGGELDLISPYVITVFGIVLLPVLNEIFVV